METHDNERGPEAACERFSLGQHVRVRAARRRAHDGAILTIQRAGRAYFCSALRCPNLIQRGDWHAAGLGHYCLDCVEPAPEPQPASPSVAAIAERIDAFYHDVGAILTADADALRCAVCGATQPLTAADAIHFTQTGWPRCCGQSMRMVRPDDA